MKAFSSKTNREYDSWEDLVADPELANGWVAIAMVAKQSEKGTDYFARCYGPWPTRKQARSKAQTIRKSFVKEISMVNNVEFLGIRIEPAWTGLDT